MNKKSTLFALYFSLIFLTINTTFSQGFLKASGTKIVNGNNQEVILKGIGLGGWLLQEGYMLKTAGFADAQWQLREKIAELIGEENTIEFYKRYHANYVNKNDIDAIAFWGFNSIRLPLHYNILTPKDQPYVYLEEGFQLLDSLLNWCEQNNLYLIIDLHAAPGGQSKGQIADYNPAEPSLWESVKNQERTVDLWKNIAERYKDKEWIGGYDILNEPAEDLGTNNAPLRNLYEDITSAIRQVDTNHIIFIEGNWYATDFNGLTPPWDDNMVYSFHKYWNATTKSTIDYLLNIRSTYNVPLWLGESGENSNAWFTECIKLMENNKIGWAWWPHKKIDNIAGPLSAPLTSGYQRLLDYWNGNASKPSIDFAVNSLMDQAEKLRIENCRFQPDVIDAIIRQTQSSTTIPFVENNIPGIIFTTNFDMGTQGDAYNDVDYKNENSGIQTAGNKGSTFRNDGVDIEKCNDFFSNGYNVGWIETGEWLKFSVNIAESGTYGINFRIAGNESGGKILLKLNGSNITDFIDIPVTGGWQNWDDVVVDGIELPAGKNEIKLYFYSGGFNINYMEFYKSTVDVKKNKNLINSFEIFQNYPNPFNPSTNIDYQIPDAGKVSINLYDLLGNKIVDLLNEYQFEGKYSISLNADKLNLTSGAYFIKIIFNETYSKIKKIILIK